MPLRKLMYISSSQLIVSTAHEAISSIVAQSLANNLRAGLTGALLFSGRYFVQILEGSNDAIDALLEVLRADGRHKDLIVISDRPIKNRKFGKWQMAYVGPSVFVDRQVGRLAANPSEAEVMRLAGWLESLLTDRDQANRCDIQRPK